jgi:hypothetical protein
MGKKAPVVLAEAKDGSLYIKVRTVMTPLVAMIDGLPVTFFGKGKTAFLRIDDAIGWCRKEMAYHSKDKYTIMIQRMEEFKANHLAGKADYA